MQGIQTFLGDNITFQGFTFLQAMWNKSRMDISQYGDYGWKKKLSRITVYSEVYDTILHSKVVYRAITHRKPHKPDIPRVFCVILSRRNCFTGTMCCYFSGNHRSTNSKHRECAFIYTCNNQSSRSDIVRIFGRIHWGRIFNKCT